MGANEHVHQRAFADAQAQNGLEHAAQALVGHQLKALEIDRQRVNLRTERRRLRNRRRGTFRQRAAAPTRTRKTTVARDMRLDRRNVDLVVFADQLHRRVGAERPAAPAADARLVIDECVRGVAQFPSVRLVSQLRPARTRTLPLRLLVGRRRLRRSPGGLLRSLHAQNQVDQLVLAQALQITSIHRAIDSEDLHASKCEV